MDSVTLDNDCGIRILRKTFFESLYLGEGLTVVGRNGENKRSTDAGSTDIVISQENSALVVGVEVDAAVVAGKLGGISSAPGLTVIVRIAAINLSDLCSCKHLSLIHI